MHKLLLFILVLSLYSLTEAQTPPKRELRGAWITTYFGLDWPVKTQTPQQQRDGLLTIMNHHKATGINAVYFQIRSQSDAMYPSSIEPWSSDLNGVQGNPPAPLWDPLQFAIDEARKKGMDFHAWLNPYRAVGNTANLPVFAASHVAKQHPEWMLTIGTVQILNPGLTAVRDYITGVVVDVLTRYDIDGIHFDDYFYPTGTTGDNTTYTSDPRGFTNIEDWRRDNINLLIKRVNDSIIKIKPWVKFGVSPSGIYRSSTNPTIGSNTSPGANQHYLHNFADTRKWLQQGWIDYLTPQLYWYIGQTGSDYGILVPWWNDNAYGRHIYIGMAAYKVNDPAQGPNWADRSQIPSQIRMNRSSLYPNIHGEIYFRTQNLRNNPLNFRDSIRIFYSKPALLPSMPWRDAIAPLPASSLTAVKYANDSVVLKWIKPAPTTNESDKVKQFVIYRSINPSIDTSNALNILTITTNDTTAYRDTTVIPNTEYYYTVTALDRFHNESSKTNTVNNQPPRITCPAVQQLVLNNNCSALLNDYKSLVVVTASATTTVTQLPLPGTVINGLIPTTVTLTATDMAGNSGNCSFTINPLDNTPPAITNVSSDSAILLNPDHTMRNITVSYVVADNCGAVIKELSVKSNEPEFGTDISDVGPDWEIVDGNHLKLRAERAAAGNGRIYTVTVTIRDASGNSSMEDLLIKVPNNGPLNIATIKVIPNPTTNYFTLQLLSDNNEPFSIRVTDIAGRTIEKRNSIAANSSLALGHNYASGIYIIELQQGKNKKSIKVLKSAR
ncbi:MAG: family 10 glycosylhydrolase [Ferruginibacter sp.]